jgi:hypothetical protein
LERDLPSDSLRFPHTQTGRMQTATPNPSAAPKSVPPPARAETQMTVHLIQRTITIMPVEGDDDFDYAVYWKGLLAGYLKIDVRSIPEISEEIKATADRVIEAMQKEGASAPTPEQFVDSLTEFNIAIDENTAHLAVFNPLLPLPMLGVFQGMEEAALQLCLSIVQMKEPSAPAEAIEDFGAGDPDFEPDTSEQTEREACDLLIQVTKMLGYSEPPYETFDDLAAYYHQHLSTSDWAALLAAPLLKPRLEAWEEKK